jgi:hypothetical protein
MNLWPDPQTNPSGERAQIEEDPERGALAGGVYR